MSKMKGSMMVQLAAMLLQKRAKQLRDMNVQCVGPLEADALREAIDQLAFTKQAGLMFIGVNLDGEVSAGVVGDEETLKMATTFLAGQIEVEVERAKKPRNPLTDSFASLGTLGELLFGGAPDPRFGSGPDNAGGVFSDELSVQCGCPACTMRREIEQGASQHGRG